MDSNVRYLAEEVAENCADGHLNRREAMRQLSFLGFSTVAASALLAACGSDDDESASSQGSTTPPTTVSSGPTTTGPPLATENITWQGNGITMMGVYAKAASPKGAVLVIHENRGITDFVRTMTGKLAASGYTALAVDLLSAQGGTAALPDQAQLQSALTQNASTRSTEDMKSALIELGKRAPGLKQAAIGFCFGGNMTWQLLAAGDPPPLTAGVPYYGQLTGDDLSKTKAAVMSVYAELDTRVNANREAATSAMEKARLVHQVKTYPGVQHAFMNNTGANYNQQQADAAYADMMAWFGTHLR
ncbi:MAG: dienelactone hydrolase family protein [Acidimicrobiales bacterium]